MQRDYFRERIAHLDDHRLAQAKLKNIVPQGCLLGGELVEERALRGEDPCAACHATFDRATVCGGREQTRAAPAFEDVDDDAPGARALRHQRYCAVLDELVPE